MTRSAAAPRLLLGRSGQRPRQALNPVLAISAALPSRFGGAARLLMPDALAEAVHFLHSRRRGPACSPCRDTEEFAVT